MSRSRILACVVALSAVIATASPASAATRTRNDPAGDAPKRFDILKATYSNNSEALTAKIKVTDLTDRANQLRLTFSTAPMRRDNAQFEMYAKRTAAGNTSRKLYVRQGGSWTQLTCRNLRVRWKLTRDLITARVPTFCLGEGYGDQRVYSNLGPPRGEPKDTAIRTQVPYN